MKLYLTVAIVLMLFTTTSASEAPKKGPNMSSTRNIIKSFRIEVAAAERKCHASSKHKISKGEEHFAYDDPGRINICKSCAPDILDAAELHLEKIRSELNC